MEFKKVLRGYDPDQVDKYIADTAERETATRRAQRERIEELSEENYNLRERIVELQRMQNDISDAMITAQRVATEIEKNAKENADKALLEAKKFYATWQAYAKTIIATFTDDEIAAFNTLQNKIGNVIAAYESKLQGGVKSDAKPSDEAVETPALKRKADLTPNDFAQQMEEAAAALSEESHKLQSQDKQPGPVGDNAANPISRVEQAAGQSIDLRELVRPTQSLEEICADLGLIGSEDE